MAYDKTNDYNTLITIAEDFFEFLKNEAQKLDYDQDELQSIIHDLLK